MQQNPRARWLASEQARRSVRGVARLACVLAVAARAAGLGLGSGVAAARRLVCSVEQAGARVRLSVAGRLDASRDS